MVRIVPYRDFLDRIGAGRTVTLGAYVLAPGRLVRALEEAARRGARVTVRLDGTPAGPGSGARLRMNARTLAELRAAGANAAFAAGGLHLKGAVVDGAAYLDDTNWRRSGAHVLLRDNDAADVAAVGAAVTGTRIRPHSAGLSLDKRGALAQEAGVLLRTRGAIAVESESLGSGNAVYRTVFDLAASGRTVRLLLTRAEMTARTRSAAERLAADGVIVRTGAAREKLAVAARSAWVGSANATYAGTPARPDWGLRTHNPALVRALHAHFERNWREAAPLR